MTKKKKSKQGQSQHDIELYRKVLQVFRSYPRQAFNYKQIAFEVPSSDINHRENVRKLMEYLVHKDKIEETQRGKFRYIISSKQYLGVVDFTRKGAGFVRCDEFEEEIHISKENTGRALQGDEVLIELLRYKAGSRPIGKIVEVTKRHRTEFVGTVELLSNFAFVIPDNSKIHVDFFVAKADLNGARDGDKVLLEMYDWPGNVRNPYAEVIQVLGKAGDNNTEMHSILAEFGFRTDFPADVDKEAEALPGKVSKEEIAKRRDFRKTTTFTIDPDTAKDFDDAISIEILSNGNVEVGVHIADVSHYVTPGSALDNEAYERATSVYLVDRTVPMLPERISNELCSLRPKEESLCFSALFELNSKAQIVNQWFGKGIIYSDHRFTYEDAQEVIDNGKGVFHDELKNLNDLAHILRNRRFQQGSISFESNEFKFELDENGVPLKVIKKVRIDTHKLVEEFMLLTNRKIAEFVSKKYKGKFLAYRVHEPPSEEKLENFLRMSKRLGYPIKTGSHLELATSINTMVSATEGKPEANILHPLAIRSMEKAFYTTKQTSHFGLAFDFYCHFTSPIRRYPDLITHRLLFAYLNNEKGANQNAVEEACRQSSKMEVKAVSAERASIKYKQTEFLSQYTGDKFDGIISGVTEWGIFVELTDNHCEGMIRLRDMHGDLYEFYEDKMAVVGRRTRKKYVLGDQIRIKIKKTNLVKRTVDFVIVK
jgi:ribonuclease R